MAQSCGITIPMDLIILYNIAYICEEIFSHANTDYRYYEVALGQYRIKISVYNILTL